MSVTEPSSAGVAGVAVSDGLAEVHATLGATAVSVLAQIVDSLDPAGCTDCPHLLLK